MPECVFCGQPAPPTREHVIPLWLQHYFDLLDQELLLWNGTTLPYRKVTVPMCQPCNGVRFSRLETRILEGTASLRDYYLWALKVTYGLGQKDATLRRDRASPQAGPLLPRAVADDMGEFVRQAFRGLDSPDFQFKPDPFGTVMFIESSSTDFLLIDVPRPYRAVAVALPDHRHLIVLPDDRGVIATMCKKKRYRESIQQVVRGVGDQDQVKFKLFAVLTFLSHLDIPRDYTADETGLYSPRLTRRLPITMQPRQLYRDIAAVLHVPVALADEHYARHAPRYGGYLLWR
jgi:hypothetical protein